MWPQIPRPQLQRNPLNSNRAASPFVRLVEGEEGWVLLQNWSGNKPNRSVSYIVLMTTDNDRRLLASCHDESRGP
ncbi:hypothetical protein TNCV_3406761 [Trichonephila clavipes]|nr:hypothetical protein TNCV_3406761 [Trichonephila clavipes]